MKLGFEIAHHLDIFTNQLHQSIPNGEIGASTLIRFKHL
jgi:hypothetical protein